MAKPRNQTEREGRRAKRVALRTLQRRPNLIGENDLGEPIVDVGSIRLVLPHGGQYLHHLGTCTRCAKVTLGDAVTSASDLQRRVSNVFCAECARVSGTEESVGGEVGATARVDFPPRQPVEPAEPSAPQPAESPRPAPADPPRAAPAESPRPAPPESPRPAPPESPRSAPAEPPRPAPPDPPRAAPAEPPHPAPPDPPRAAPAEPPRAAPAEPPHPRPEKVQPYVAPAPEPPPTDDAGLEKHAQVLGAELGTVLANRLDLGLNQLGTVLANRFDQGLNQLGAALANRFDQSLRELAASSGPVTGDQDALVARLETIVRGGLAEQRKVLESELAVARRVERGLHDVRTTAGESEEGLGALAATFASRLQDDEDKIVSRLETVFCQALVEQREELLPELGAMVSPFRQGVEELGVSLGGRFAQDLEKLAATLAGGLFDEQTQLVSRLETSLRDGLAEQRQVVSSELQAAAAEQRQALPEIATALAGPLESGLAEVRAALATRLEEGFAELAGALSNRLRDDQNKLGARVEAAVGVLLAGRFEQGLRELGLRLGDRLHRDHDQLVSQLAEALSAAREHDRMTLTSDSASALADLDRRMRTARDELYDRLERVAEGAAEAGTIAARALVRSTQEYAAASAVTLAANISDLQREMLTTQERLTELLEAVERLDRRSSAAATENRAPARKAPAKPAARKAPAKNGLKSSTARSRTARR